MKDKIQVIIVDDEAPAIEVIDTYLKPYPEFKVMATFTSSKKALEAIVQQQPDLIFLDIKMPKLNGFQLLEAVLPHYNPYVIFTTAFDAYAIQAFEIHAIGYLLKPIEKDKFTKAILYFLELYHSRKLELVYAGISSLLGEQTQAKPAPLERIKVKEARQIVFIPVSEVVYIEAFGDYVKVHTASKEHVADYSISGLEKELPANQFRRIHRSHIVNIQKITSFIPSFNGEYTAVMSSGVQLKVSRHYKHTILQDFKGL
ncbi:MAG: LytTR family DNA-binding domain-containing protein [Sediminibacterium sp.]|nr:LytTR family DNA-binding domain-containing protein [Sediminibacterium sp.]